jgi:hypothetical protein
MNLERQEIITRNSWATLQSPDGQGMLRPLLVTSGFSVK